MLNFQFCNYVWLIGWNGDVVMATTTFVWHASRIIRDSTSKNDDYDTIYWFLLWIFFGQRRAIWRNCDQAVARAQALRLLERNTDNEQQRWWWWWFPMLLFDIYIYIYIAIVPMWCRCSKSHFAFVQSILQAVSETHIVKSKLTSSLAAGAWSDAIFIEAVPQTTTTPTTAGFVIVIWKFESFNESTMLATLPGMMTVLTVPPPTAPPGCVDLVNKVYNLFTSCDSITDWFIFR